MELLNVYYERRRRREREICEYVVFSSGCPYTKITFCGPALPCLPWLRFDSHTDMSPCKFMYIHIYQDEKVVAVPFLLKLFSPFFLNMYNLSPDQTSRRNICIL